MNPDDFKKEIQSLDNTAWLDFLQWVNIDEYERRKALPLVSEAEAAVIKKLQDQGLITKPDALTDPENLPEDVSDIPEWIDPKNDPTAAYRYGDIIRVGDRVYIGNVAELIYDKPSLETTPNKWVDITPTPPDKEDGSLDKPFTWRIGFDFKEGQYVKHSDTVYKVLRDHEAVDPEITPDKELGFNYEKVTAEEGSNEA